MVSEFPEQLKAYTPCCFRKVTPFNFMFSATTVSERTCPKCKQRWIVKIKPYRMEKNNIGVGCTHVLEWNRVTSLFRFSYDG